MVIKGCFLDMGPCLLADVCLTWCFARAKPWTTDFLHLALHACRPVLHALGLLASITTRDERTPYLSYRYEHSIHRHISGEEYSREGWPGLFQPERRATTDDL